MQGIRCPMCRQAELLEEVSETRDVEFEGVSLVVQDLHTLRCPDCGETSFAAGELRRLKRLKNEYLERQNQVPKPSEVRAVRTALDLSVSQFAALLGVTRQAVYSWEDDRGIGIKFGPSAILISLLCSEASASVFSTLLAMAHSRGQLNEIAKPSPQNANPQEVRKGVPRLRTIPQGGNFFCSETEVKVA